jgi:BCD family chlorophyll transporter-like MFS transporter
LVQSAIGAIVVLTTATFNRVMVVEMALPASLPAAFVAWHYTVQLSRPHWGHGSDGGSRRTSWITAGMGVLALGAILAANATVLMAAYPTLGIVLGALAFAMIGAGVSASGTCLLALMASRVAQDRRPAAASITWVMMIFGIVLWCSRHSLRGYAVGRVGRGSGA